METLPTCENDEDYVLLRSNLAIPAGLNGPLSGSWLETSRASHASFVEGLGVGDDSSDEDDMGEDDMGEEGMEQGDDDMDMDMEDDQGDDLLADEEDGSERDVGDA